MTPVVSECVVLVHGLWMRGVVFGLMRRRLERNGFMVRTYSYPTIRGGLDVNVAGLQRFVTSIRALRIHLVAHSLGGLVVLALLSGAHDPRIARVVLMGAPCNGSRSASVLARLPLFRQLLGRSLNDWLAEPRRPLAGSVEIGVIAGNGGVGLGRILPGLPVPNDGLVSVAETNLPEACDSITLGVAHSRMLFSRRCADLIVAFLRKGRFRE